MMCGSAWLSTWRWKQNGRENDKLVTQSAGCTRRLKMQMCEIVKHHVCWSLTELIKRFNRIKEFEFFVSFSDCMYEHQVE